MNNLIINDLQPGDVIHFQGDASIRRIKGVIVKVNQVTIDLLSSYMDQTLDIRVRKDKLRGKGYIQRDNEIYEVKYV